VVSGSPTEIYGRDQGRNCDKQRHDCPYDASLQLVFGLVSFKLLLSSPHIIGFLHYVVCLFFESFGTRFQLVESAGCLVCGFGRSS
jgi:hypothetical protein